MREATLQLSGRLITGSYTKSEHNFNIFSFLSFNVHKTLNMCFALYYHTEATLQWNQIWILHGFSTSCYSFSTARWSTMTVCLWMRGVRGFVTSGTD